MLLEAPRHSLSKPCWGLVEFQQEWSSLPHSSLPGQSWGLNGRILFGDCNDIIEQKDQLQVESTRVNQREWGGKMISHINARDIPGQT